MLIEASDASRAVLAASNRVAWSFRVLDLEVDGDKLEMLIEGKRGGVAWMSILEVGRGERQYWLYAEPNDADDWAVQLLNWIDEEVITGGLGPGRFRRVVADRSYVQAETYGWRMFNAAEHARLSSQTPPHTMWPGTAK
ncbi:hypothetical protein [Marisediminicola senii]|uniref:hypothetical protein n=1 Tax=Marisediminicola senii TaxID=2711233 RepID=UPI0013EA5D7D|nr:hypothetical protein [Marisediminicola senii]